VRDHRHQILATVTALALREPHAITDGELA
jgi:hypothetical protein